jgi:glycosyltransferase involved in cell wall biosynthesis
MEIWVVDDFSTKDDPEAVVNAIGKGRVKFFRQSQNVGHTRNFATCLNLSRGHLIHLLHGDDKVKDGFYRHMQALFEKNSGVGAAFCRYAFIDEKGGRLSTSRLEQEHSGVLNNWIRKIAESQIVQTPSIVVKREVYERLGGFDQTLSFSEDWEMWVRIAVNYPIGYVPEPLAEYRVHNSNITSKTRTGARNIDDLKRCINMIHGHMNEAERDEIRKKALKFYAKYALTEASRSLFQNKDKITARMQLHKALGMDNSIGFFIEFANLYRHLILI